MIRISLPAHLRLLAKLNGEVSLPVAEPVTIRSIVDAVEAAYPMLGGTIRDHITKQRRPLVRFFVCGEDWSHEPIDKEMPAPILKGAEPFLIVGSIAGG